MITIEAFQVSDGRIFADEDTAKQAQDDIIGEELDGLLKMFDLDITRPQQHRALLLVMKNRKELLNTLRTLVAHLDHEESNDKHQS
jgi:hypothetical protein